MKILEKHIGDLICEIRKEKQITAKKLADSTKKSQSYISMLENGNIKKPRKETVIEILSAMELSDKEIEKITDNYYEKKPLKVKKVGKKILVRNESENSESKNDFIQNPTAPLSKGKKQKRTKAEKDYEEVLFKIKDQHELSAEISSIAFHLGQVGKILESRKVLDTEYDYVKFGLHSTIDRLELVLVGYRLYVEKRLFEDLDK